MTSSVSALVAAVLLPLSLTYLYWRVCHNQRFGRANATPLSFTAALVIVVVTSCLRCSAEYDFYHASLWTQCAGPCSASEATADQSAAAEPLSLAEHAVQLDLFGREHGTAAAGVALSAAVPLQHVVIVTAGLDGAVLGGGIGTAYSALTRRLAAFGHTVQVLYMPYPAHRSAPPVNRTELASLYSAAASASIAVDQLLVTHSSCVASKLLPPSVEQQPVLYRAVRGCSYACIRSYHAYRWLAAHLRRLSAEGGVVVHVQDNAGLGYFISQAHTLRLLPRPVTLVLGSHAPHLWERTANAAADINGEDMELDWMERSTAASVDWLVSPSRYILGWMAEQGWTYPPHVAVQPNLLPQLPSAEQIDQRARDLLEFRTRQPLQEIVFFGRLELRKGLFLFLDALQLLFADEWSDPEEMTRWSAGKLLVSFLGPDTRSEHAGAQWTSHVVRARCRDIFEPLRDTLDVRCVLHTNLSRHASLSYLDRHLQPPPLVVIASPIDNSPYTVLECLTLGVPFLAAAVGGIPELVHRDMQPHDAQQHLFEPTPLQLAAKLRDVAMRGLIWLPMMNRADDERAWREWHHALPRAADALAAHTIPSADESRPALAVCIVYPGSLGKLRALHSAVLEQRTIDAYDVQLIVVRLPHDSVDSADGSGADDNTSVTIRSELNAVRASRGWSTLLLSIPAVNFAGGLSYWQWTASQVHSDYYLFLNRQHTLYGRTSIELLMRAAVSSGAGLTTGFVYDAIHGKVVLDLGSAQRGLASSLAASRLLVNRSVLVRRSALHSLSTDQWDETEGGENQRRHAALNTSCVPEPLFTTREQ